MLINFVIIPAEVPDAEEEFYTWKENVHQILSRTHLARRRSSLGVEVWADALPCHFEVVEGLEGATLAPTDGETDVKDWSSEFFNLLDDHPVFDPLSQETVLGVAQEFNQMVKRNLF